MIRRGDMSVFAADGETVGVGVGVGEGEITDAEHASFSPCPPFSQSPYQP
jgi:hypothetical protein